MARKGWTRALTGKLVPPGVQDGTSYREAQGRIAKHAERMANAKPMTEAEIQALIAAYPKDAVKRLEPVAEEEPEVLFGRAGQLRRAL